MAVFYSCRKEERALKLTPQLHHIPGISPLTLTYDASQVFYYYLYHTDDGQLHGIMFLHQVNNLLTQHVDRWLDGSMLHINLVYA